MSALLGGIRQFPLLEGSRPCVGGSSALVPPGEVALDEEEDGVTAVVLGLFGFVLVLFWVWLSDIRQNLERTRSEIARVKADVAQMKKVADLLERST